VRARASTVPEIRVVTSITGNNNQHNTCNDIITSVARTRQTEHKKNTYTSSVAVPYITSRRRLLGNAKPRDRSCARGDVCDSNEIVVTRLFLARKKKPRRTGWTRNISYPARRSAQTNANVFVLFNKFVLFLSRDNYQNPAIRFLSFSRIFYGYVRKKYTRPVYELVSVLYNLSTEDV